MYGLCASLLTGGDDLVRDEIAFGGLRGTNVHRFIRHFHERRTRICIGINGDGCDTHPARGLDDPASDFTAIGD